MIGVAASLESGFVKTLLQSLGSAGLSIGGIGLLYEAYLRRTQTEDVLELVRLEDRLVKAGIEDITRKPTVDWVSFFTGAQLIKLLPANPISWMADEWVHVLEARPNAGMQVDVYLPAPEGEAVPLLAKRIDAAAAVIKGELEQALRRVETDWKDAVRLRQADARARLVIHTYDGVAAMGIAATDRGAVLSLPGVFQTRAGQAVLSFRFGRSVDGVLAGWLDQQFSDLPNLGTHYESHTPLKGDGEQDTGAGR